MDFKINSNQRLSVNQNEIVEHASNVNREEYSTASNNITSGSIEITKSFFSNLITYGAVFLAGSFNLSPLWLIFPIVVTMVKEHWKAKKEIDRLNFVVAALKNEELVTTSVNHLPTWVNFPDVERCEWINNILSQIWPNFNIYFKDVLKTTVELQINENLLSYIKDSFKFSIVNLGSLPPRLTGIKVYGKNVNRKEVVMDLNLFYVGDCEISFVFLGLSGGIQNFQIHGLLRLVMRPLIPTLPLIGGLDIFFVNQPKIDFNMVGVADFLDFPGLSGKLRQLIDDQIASLIVQPNKIHISLSDSLYSPESVFSEIEGVLCVNVIEAKDLMDKDLNLRKKDVSDPYVVTTVGEHVYESRVVKDSLNPKWDFWAEFVIESIYNETLLNVKVMDKDELTQDSFLGVVSVDIVLIKQKGKLESWLQLEETKKGIIHLSLVFYSLSSNIADYNFDYSGFMSSSVLSVYLDSAQNLANPKPTQAPNSFVQLSVGNNDSTSKTVISNCPVFKETFSFLIKNPEINKLSIKLFDQKSGSSLGHTSVTLKQILNSANMEVLDYSYPLIDSASDSTITLSMRLRVLKMI